MPHLPTGKAGTHSFVPADPPALCPAPPGAVGKKLTSIRLSGGESCPVPLCTVCCLFSSPLHFRPPHSFRSRSGRLPFHQEMLTAVLARWIAGESAVLSRASVACTLLSLHGTSYIRKSDATYRLRRCLLLCSVNVVPRRVTDGRTETTFLFRCSGTHIIFNIKYMDIFSLHGKLSIHLVPYAYKFSTYSYSFFQLGNPEAVQIKVPHLTIYTGPQCVSTLPDILPERQALKSCSSVRMRMLNAVLAANAPAL